MTEQLLSHRLTPHNELPSSRERQTLHLFHTHTIAHIASHFDHAFWSVDVARASLSFPAVWHAVLALATVHLHAEALRDPATAQHDAQQQYVFALTHYNIALGHLVSLVKKGSMGHVDQDVVLISVVLFISTCALLGEAKELTVHAHYGLRLFYQWKIWDDRWSSSDRQTGRLANKDAMVSLMNRIEGQFTRSDHPRTWHSSVSVRWGSGAPFESILDAYIELQPLMSGLLELFRSGTLYEKGPRHPHPLPDARLPYRQAIKDWTMKCAHLTKLLSGNDDASIVQKASIQIWLTSIEILFESDVARSELAWDRFQHVFEKIVSVAEISEKKSLTSSATGHGQAASTGDRLYWPSMCEALSFVAERCRDPSIRRRALSLMRASPRQEGLWDTNLLVAIAAARIEIEESGPASNDRLRAGECLCVTNQYVCQEHRVVSAAVEFQPDRKAKVFLKSTRHVASKEQGGAVLITW